MLNAASVPIVSRRAFGARAAMLSKGAPTRQRALRTADRPAAFPKMDVLQTEPPRPGNAIPRPPVYGKRCLPVPNGSGRHAKDKDRSVEYSYLLSVPFSPPAAKTAMAASVAMAKAKNRTNFTIVVPLFLPAWWRTRHGRSSAAARRHHMARCLTRARGTGLKPSLNLFGDFLEITAARGFGAGWARA